MPNDFTDIEIKADDIELGSLFGELNVTVVFGTHVGATVSVDGNVLATTNLVSVEGMDRYQVKKNMRTLSVRAICEAHAEIGLVPDMDLIRRDVARRLRFGEDFPTD